MTTEKIRKLQYERLDVLTQARRALAGITDTSTPEELRAAEAEHDKLIIRIDEIDREILDLQNPDPRRPIRADATVGGDGPEPRWHDASTGREVRVVQHGETFSTERPELGVGAALRALILGARNDAEKRALSEGTDSAGGFTVPTPLAGQFIDLMRARSHVMSAGAQTVVMPSETLGIARVATDPVPGWRSEAASLAESDPTLSKLTFTARSLGVLVKVSRELVQDSANIEQILETVFAAAFAQELDRVALLGSGSAPEPKGIANWAGVAEVDMGTDGAAITSYAPLLSALQALEDANSQPPGAFIMAPRTKYAIAGLTATDNQPLIAPAVVSAVPFYATSKMRVDETHGTADDASRIITGDFRQLLVGMRQELRIEVLRERYADTLQLGFIAFMRADIQLAQPTAFAQVTGIIPA